MIVNHFKLLGKPNGLAPKVIGSREGIAMWEDGLAAPEGGCNISLTYSVENTTYVWNTKLRLKCKIIIFNKN